MAIDSPMTPEAALEGRRGLEAHYAAFSPHQDNDFRASTLNQLVLGLLPPGRVLDLGCGSGALSALLLAQGREVISQDMSPEMLELCRQRLGERGLTTSGIRECDAASMPETGAFDAVVCLDVIEHIDRDAEALRAIHRVLRPGGTLVLSVPALSALYGPKDVAVGHFRRYDETLLRMRLAEAGFAIERLRWWNAIGIAPVWLTLRLRGGRVNEDFRYAGRSRIKRALNEVLRRWFLHVENRVSFGRGLTLLVRATR